MSPSYYVVIAVIVASFLIYVYERMRSSIPPKVAEDMKDLALKMRDTIPAEYLPFLTTVVKKVEPIALNAEKIAIREAKALLQLYAQQTSSPLDDNLCQWLDNLEKEKAPD